VIWDKEAFYYYAKFSNVATMPPEQMGILSDVTGSGKSKMAVYKLSIYRLVDEIE